MQFLNESNLFKNTKSFEEKEYTFLTNRIFVKNSNYPTIMAVMDKLKQAKVTHKMLIVGKESLLNDINEYNYCLSSEKVIVSVNTQA